LGWSFDPGPPLAGKCPAFLISVLYFADGSQMKELSIFIDESGDFGEYSYHSPYYIITMVFHDQDVSVESDIIHLNNALAEIGLKNHCIHSGPLIRREEEYRNMDIKTRQAILNKMIAFVRRIDIQYKSFYIEKKHIESRVEVAGKLAKKIGNFIRENYEKFTTYDVIKVYYDNGQVEVSKILSSVFNALLQNVEFKRVMPSEYKLFQVADLFCTFELLKLKLEASEISQSEKIILGNEKNIKKNYLKVLNKKEIN